MGVAEREDELDTEQHEDTETIEDESQDDAADEGGGSEGGEDAGDGQDEDVVQIGSEEPPASEEAKVAPEWVKELRRRYREKERENAELRAKLGTGQPAQAPTLPAKPKLADFDYDEEQFQAALDNWHAKKREVEAHEANQRAAVEAQQRRVQAINEQFEASKKALKVKDYQEAEDEAAAALDQVQQSLIKAGASNPALLVYALGKNPKKLQELASIKDPVKFAVAVGKLETEVKVTKRTSTKPPPESAVRGSSSSATSTSETLKRLQAEADRTGDRSKVAAYLRQQRQAGK